MYEQKNKFLTCNKAENSFKMQMSLIFQFSYLYFFIFLFLEYIEFIIYGLKVIHQMLYFTIKIAITIMYYIIIIDIIKSKDF